MGVILKIIWAFRCKRCNALKAPHKDFCCTQCEFMYFRNEQKYG